MNRNLIIQLALYMADRCPDKLERFARIVYDEWKENEHPRDEDGKFAKTNSSKATGLSSGFGGTFQPSVVAKEERIDYNDAEAIERSFDEFLKTYVNSDIENAEVITSDGRKTTIRGSSGNVDIELAGDLTGAVAIHNHPNESDCWGDCFSKEDFVFFFAKKLKELRVISGLGVFSLKYSGEYLNEEQAWMLYNEAKNRVYGKRVIDIQGDFYEQLTFMNEVPLIDHNVIFKKLR